MENENDDVRMNTMIMVVMIMKENEGNKIWLLLAITASHLRFKEATMCDSELILCDVTDE